MMNSNSSHSNLRILIVDDNPAIHEDYRKILHSEVNDEAFDELSAFILGAQKASTQLPEFELSSAYQGQEAKEMVRDAVQQGCPYAVAFVDMRMPPGWDGLETLENLWEVDPNLQIVICTAYSDYSWSDIIERVAYRDQMLILKKPFDEVEVCQLALALTQKWELERLAASQMHCIVETAADGIITLTEDGIIESCNGASCDLFGFSKEEFQGSAFTHRLDGYLELAWEQCARQMLPDDEVSSSRAFDFLGVRKDGSIVPLLLSLSVYMAPDGRRYTAILRDLTEYKYLQASLEQARKMESVGQLAAGVAHEINTPLQYIYQNMEFLQSCSAKLKLVYEAFESNLSMSSPAKSWQSRWSEVSQVLEENQFDMIRDELPQAIDESIEGVQRVVSLVRAMKEFSHPGQEHKVRVDLNRVIESAVTITRNCWKDVALIELDLDQELGDVCCVSQDMNQLFLNLIVNARDAIVEQLTPRSPEKGLITLRTKKSDDHAVVEVVDTGCGIPAEIIDRIYDPFFTTKEVGKGSGQGLAICYNIVVSKHQGTIDVQSTPGEGTTFTIRLPWETKTCGGAKPEKPALSCSS